MPPGNPAGYAQPQQNPGGNMMQMIMGLLAGGGFKNITKGVKELGESGVDLQNLMSLPNLPMMMAGAGVKDFANSMEILQPMMQALMPPAPPPGPKPQEIGAAMQMLSARMGPGLSGIQAPPPPPMPPPGMGMGPPPGMGMGGPPPMLPGQL
jgi:hypothetical protein